MTTRPGGAAGHRFPPAPGHPRAVLSLVLGVLAVALCALLGPVAWWVSRHTLREIDASEGGWGGRRLAQAGYVLGIVGTLLLGALLTVLLVVLLSGSAVYL